MNKNIKPKTILIISLLVVGVILFILGNKYPYCLGFGMVLLGSACFFYAFEKTKELDALKMQAEENYFGYKGNDVALIAEYQYKMKFYKKQSFKTKVVFYTFSVLMVVFGLLMIF